MLNGQTLEKAHESRLNKIEPAQIRIKGQHFQGYWNRLMCSKERRMRMIELIER